MTSEQKPYRDIDTIEASDIVVKCFNALAKEFNELTVDVAPSVRWVLMSRVSGLIYSATYRPQLHPLSEQKEGFRDE